MIENHIKTQNRTQRKRIEQDRTFNKTEDKIDQTRIGHIEQTRIEHNRTEHNMSEHNIYYNIMEQNGI